MYCYNCGNIIYNGTDKCLFCGLDTQVINNFVFGSKINKIVQSITQINNTKEVFHIGDNIVTILEENILAVTLNKFSSCIFEASWKELFEWITQYSFDAIIEKGAKKLESLMVATELAAAALMKKMGCYVDSRIVEEKLSCDRKNILKLTDPFYDLKVIKDQLDDMKEESFDNIKKKYTTQKSSRWVGGGFGVTGAIKGQLTAGIMNLGETAIQGVFNSIGSFAEKSQIRSRIEKAKSDLHKSFEFQLYFQSLWRDYIKKFHCTLKNVVLSQFKSKNMTADYNWGENLKYDFSTYDEESAIKKLNTNVYDLNAYISLYLIDRKNGKDLCRLADYCGILDIVESAFLQYSDGKIIANLNANKLGYDLSDNELAFFKKAIDELEENNTVFQRLSTDLYTMEAQKYSKEFNELPCEKVKEFYEEYEKDAPDPYEDKNIFLWNLVIKEQEYSKKINELCPIIEIKKTKYNKDRVLKIKEKTISIDMEKICILENICSMDQNVIATVVSFIDSISARKNYFEIAALRNRLYNIFKCVKEENEEAFKFFINYFVDNSTRLSSEILLECVIGRRCYTYANFISKDGTLNRNNFSYVEQAVKDGNVFAMSIIGNFYMTTQSQKDLGIKFIEKASQSLEITALQEIENWYEFGKNGYLQDKEKAEQYFLLSFVMGDKEAAKKFLELKEI